jgi:hypothetical protein
LKEVIQYQLFRDKKRTEDIKIHAFRAKEQVIPDEDPIELYVNRWGGSIKNKIMAVMPLIEGKLKKCLEGEDAL